jgi:hypothetical protein
VWVALQKWNQRLLASTKATHPPLPSESPKARAVHSNAIPVASAHHHHQNVALFFPGNAFQKPFARLTSLTNYKGHFLSPEVPAINTVLEELFRAPCYNALQRKDTSTGNTQKAPCPSCPHTTVLSSMSLPPILIGFMSVLHSPFSSLVGWESILIGKIRTSQRPTYQHTQACQHTHQHPGTLW